MGLIERPEFPLKFTETTGFELYPGAEVPSMVTGLKMKGRGLPSVMIPLVAKVIVLTALALPLAEEIAHRRVPVLVESESEVTG